ncbi:MAG TPA: hypothetical protein VKC60_18735 [Opitutaceae bacterium]|nr:hypothetical protein [Opitutaceae bacterium]
MSCPRPLDEHEKAIARQLIRNPRATDKSISVATGIQLRSVGRKRQKLEKEGLLRYWTTVDPSARSTIQSRAKHVYILKLGLGIGFDDAMKAVLSDPKQMDFGDLITDGYCGEIDGRLAFIFFVEGENDRSILQDLHKRLISKMVAEHGKEFLEDISTLRIVRQVRTLRNYLTGSEQNLDGGTIRAEWPDQAIYVGQ